MSNMSLMFEGNGLIHVEARTIRPQQFMNSNSQNAVISAVVVVHCGPETPKSVRFCEPK